MNQKTMMIAAIAVVAVVIVAGAAVVMMNNDKDENSSGDTSNRLTPILQIRGNANGDYKIDSSDLNIVKDVIDGKKTLKDYPLADANNDGKVDQTDVDLLNDILDRKNETVMHVLSYDISGNQIDVSVKYPLNNIVPLGTNIIEPLIYVGASNYMAGYFYSSYTNAEKPMTDHATDLKGPSRGINDASWKNFNDLDAKLKADSGSGIGALVLDYSVKNIDSTYMSDLEAAKIPLLIFPSADAVSEVAAATTVSFLLGSETEEIGKKYAIDSYTVIDQIEAKVSKLTDDQKSNFICLNMNIYVCQNDSTFNTTPVTAGGLPYYKVNAKFAEKYAGSSSTKMASVEALSNYKDIEHMFNIKTVDVGTDDINAQIISVWDATSTKGVKYIDYFKDLENYEDLVYVNNILPGAVKLAYMAHILYPEDFSRDWANSVFNTFVDGKYGALDGQSLTSVYTLITYDDYQNALKAKS